ncbi:RNA polymerase sigma factor FliA [Achromobacter xylosoxidans]|uniref:RNA polymerase sigma factor FliA n=4 Tax=Alcaligenes xylosoxydans xylosoxydans TaxID=85698 RepID=UPI0006BEE3A2|nr:RNA polymerase sigma factor FliA [Achromobacter xylosoxidans]WPQ35586.1 RNA polymerase sigma factor FliA [Achromobacter xylosoxidans]CUJ28941.1 Sigma-F factor [Achromobacter xylosoxidans]
MPHADDSLVEYAPLVRKLALQLLARLPASVELDDLIQAGMIGLLDAVRRYQETADAQFETYATTRIRGAMLDELRGQDWLPRSVRAKARKIEQAIQSLEQRLMRAPTEAEIAQQMEIPLNEYQTLLHDAQGVQIVHYEDFATEPDTGSGSGSGSGQSDWTATLNHGAASGNPLDSLLAGDFRQALIHAIDSLPDREKLLLSLCYEQGLNLKEIGAIMNVTEARVCQLRSQATARIRAKLREQAWQDLPQEGQIAQII